MASSQNNSNTIKTVTFSAADFQRWNQTTSVVTIPSRLVRSSKIPQLRKEIIQAIGERKVAAVQALSPYKYRVEFRYSSDRHAADINGISFRGIHLQPLPAYEEVKSIFVDRAPLQMQDNILFETLAPYGRVLSVQHLKVKGFESVRSGTRRVSMVLTKAIPANINIGGFLVSFRYRGQPPTCFVCQEVGHTGKDCPKSRRAQKAAQQQQQQGGKNKKQGQEDLKIKIQGSERTVSALTKKQQQVDLREKIDASRAAKLAPSKAAASRSTSRTNKVKEADTLLGQSSQGAKAEAAKTVHSVTGEAVSMDTCSPPSPPQIKREAGKAKGRSSKGAGVKVTAMDPQDEVAPSVPGEAGLRAVQSLKNNNPKISTSPPAHHLAAIRQVFGMSSPSDDLEPGEIRDSESETDFRSLAKRAQSIATVATLATATPASFQYRGSARLSSSRSTRAKSVLVSAPGDVASGVAAPSVEQFSFNLTTISTTSTVTASASSVQSEWTRAYRGAVGPLPCPPQRRPGKSKIDSLQEDDDIPLLQRSQERKRRRLSSTQPVEAVDECLSGSSVFDPLNMDCPVLPSVGGSEMPPVSSPPSSHTIAEVEEMPPVSSPQVDSGTEAMLVSDPVCHTNVPAEGREMPPVSSPTINTNIGSGVTLTSDPTNNICTGPGVTSTPGPSNIINPGSGVTSTPDLTNDNNNLVEGSEIPPVSSPLSRLETESTLDSLSLSSSVAAGDTNMGWQTPPPIHSSSFPSVVGGEESPFGSVLSTPEFLPSPATSMGRFEALIGGAPVAPVSQSELEPLDSIDAINRAILTDPTCLQLLMELPEPSLESNNGSQVNLSQH